jgi:multiple sugar transport system substrate-binding protein
MRKSFRVAVRKFEPFESAIRKQWESFEHGSDLTLEVVAMDLHALYDALFEEKGLQRGEFDVAFINTDWLAMADRERAVLDLAPYLKHNAPRDYPEGWSPSLLRLQCVEDRVLGLPYHDGPETLIYRTDLFSSRAEQDAYLRLHGEPLRPPATWEEFRRIARFFHRPEKKLSGTVFAGFPDGHNTVYDFLLQLWTRGGELFDQSGRVTFATAQAVEALEFYRAMLQDRRATHPDCAAMDSVQAGMAFARGEVAMMVNWFGFAAMAETIAGSVVKGCIDLAPIPHGANGQSISLNVYWLLVIAAGSPHCEVAYEFLRHAMTPEMDKLLTLEGVVGCRKSTWADAEVNRVIPFYHRLEGLHENARELPRMETWPRIASLIDEVTTRAMGSDAPVAQLLEEAQDKAESMAQSA